MAYKFRYVTRLSPFTPIVCYPIVQLLTEFCCAKYAQYHLDVFVIESIGFIAFVLAVSIRKAS